MKKAFEIILVIMILPLLSSCVSHISLGERAIVKAICVDYNNDEYLAKLVVFTCDADTDTKSVNERAQCYEGKGANIDTAINVCEKKQNKKPFYAQNELLFISENAASKIGDDIIEYFNRQSIMGQDLAVLVTQNTDAFKNNENSAKIINDAQRIANDSTDTKGSKKLYEYSTVSNAIFGYIPYVKLEKTGCMETGIILDETIIENDNGANLIKLLDNRIKNIKLQNENITLKNININYEAKMVKNKPVLTIFVQGYIDENTAKAEKINSLLNLEFEKIIEKTYDLGNDVFGFENRLRAISSARCDELSEKNELYNNERVKIKSQLKSA
ncbi:MAG: hypothetical protein RR573_08865 [Oscillospiraceae bacterium]